jgi:hypothetical protein
MTEASADDVGDGPHIEGLLGVVIVLDRMPSAVERPTYSDIFGEVPNNVGSLLDQHVRVDQLSRFQVVVRERKIVNTSLAGSVYNVNRYIKLRGRRSVYTTFRDMGENISGRYGNIRDNAILLYTLWESPSASLMRYSINSRIVYFH